METLKSAKTDGAMSSANVRSIQTEISLGPEAEWGFKLLSIWDTSSGVQSKWSGGKSDSFGSGKWKLGNLTWLKQDAKKSFSKLALSWSEVTDVQPSDRQDDDFIDCGFREWTIAHNFFFDIWGFAKDSKKDLLALRILVVISFLRDLYLRSSPVN